MRQLRRALAALLLLLPLAVQADNSRWPDGGGGGGSGAAMIGTGNGFSQAYAISVAITQAGTNNTCLRVVSSALGQSSVSCAAAGTTGVSFVPIESTRATSLTCNLGQRPNGFDGGDTIGFKVVWYKAGEAATDSAGQVTFLAADATDLVRTVTLNETAPFAAPLSLGVRILIPADGGVAFGATALHAVCTVRAG